MTMQGSIEILTREHKTIAHTIDGAEVHTRPALLELLREAIFGGMESTGGSSMKSKLPISDAALDLYTLIDRQITEAWAQVHNIPPNTDRPEALAAQWAALVSDDVIVTVTHPEQRERWDEAKQRNGTEVIRIRTEYKAADLARRWVQQIEDFFDPPRHAEINAPCFICGERYVHRNRDGEQVRTAALMFSRDRATGETRHAECLACGTQWAPAQFRFLGEQINAESKENHEHA